jgi:hypothetical protein
MRSGRLKTATPSSSAAPAKKNRPALCPTPGGTTGEPSNLPFDRVSPAANRVIAMLSLRMPHARRRVARKKALSYQRSAFSFKRSRALSFLKRDAIAGIKKAER